MLPKNISTSEDYQNFHDENFNELPDDYFTLNLTHSPIYLNFNSELNVRKNSKNISVFLS